MSSQVVEELVKKTYAELARNPSPKLSSRVWKSSNGYIFLVVWSNASLLRVFIRRFTEALPRQEFRLKAQLNDAARSVVANIEEGYARPTTKEYLDYLGFSQASLKEVKGDIQRSLQDGFLRSIPGSNIIGLGIDFRV